MTEVAETAITPLGAVRLVELAQIRPYERNPRKIPAKAVEQTAKSIRDFGWQQPLVVDADMVIVAGHVRYAAARSLGLAAAPVVVADGLTAEQARAFRIADNRAHDYTAWDYSVLVEELGGLGEPFSDVLDLTDWGSLLAAFADQGGVHRLPEASPEALVGTGYVLAVEFATREQADQAAPSLLAIAGVLNVRHPRR